MDSRPYADRTVGGRMLDRSDRTDRCVLHVQVVLADEHAVNFQTAAKLSAS
jgi:hypothetical protein